MAEVIAFETFDATGAEPLLEQLIAVYLEVYEDADPSFFNEDRYRRQLTGHMAAPRWQVVTASRAGQIVGYIYGFALPADTSWWRGLRTEVPDAFADEDGHRTVAISELLVTPVWQRQGIARTLHDSFLRGRSEQRATLLVEPDNDLAYEAYSRWGWQKVAELQPRWDNAPRYEVLVRDL
jgi:ribosomal protein S18 acetylase RimI-like enzyme